MKPDKLYLIGTVHIDPKGPDRLTNILKALQPDVVTLERVPPYNNHLMNYLFGELTMGFELETCRRYCEKEAINLVYADRALTTIESFYDFFLPKSKKNTFRLYLDHPQGIQKAVDEGYYDIEDPNSARNMQMVHSGRDEHMASIIRQQEGRVVHVVGAAHIFEGYYNLASRLEDLNPILIRLIEADNPEKIRELQIKA